MDRDTEVLVRVGWSRVFGLPEDALTGSTCRVGVVSNTAVMTVRLWDHEVISAPASVLDQAVELDDQGRLDQDSMVRLSGPRGRFLGRADLAYTRRPVEHDLSSVVCDHDGSAVHEIEAGCSPEEVDEAGLSTMDHRFVLLDRGVPPAAGPPDMSGQPGLS